MTGDMGRRRAGVAAVGLATAVLLGLVNILPGPVTVGLLVLGIGAGWRYVPRFWSVVLRGAIGGAIAGLLVLGVGFRIAMRIVALMDPLRTAELTLEGTMLVVVMVGGVLGGIVGIVVTVLGAGLELSRGPKVAVTTAVIMGMLVGEPGLRAELLELGAGGWFNIPMFAVVATTYGAAASRFADRLDARARRRLATDPTVVRA